MSRKMIIRLLSNLTLKILEHKVEPHYFSVTLRIQLFLQKSVHVTWKEVTKLERNVFNTMQPFAVDDKSFPAYMYLSMSYPFFVAAFLIKLIM